MIYEVVFPKFGSSWELHGEVIYGGLEIFILNKMSQVIWESGKHINVK